MELNGDIITKENYIVRMIRWLNMLMVRMPGGNMDNDVTLDVPACIFPDGTPGYYTDGKKYSKDEWTKLGGVGKRK